MPGVARGISRSQFSSCGSPKLLKFFYLLEGFLGFLRIPFGFLRIPLGSLGFLGCLGVSLVSLGFLGAALGSLKFLRVTESYLQCLGFLRVMGFLRVVFPQSSFVGILRGS